MSFIARLAGLRQEKKAGKAEKRANQAQREINRIRNRQNQRQFLREFRQAQAAALVDATAAGVDVESSRVQGTIASQRSQAQTAGFEFREMDRLGGEVTRFRNEVTTRRARASAFSTIADIGSSFIPG